MKKLGILILTLFLLSFLPGCTSVKQATPTEAPPTSTNSNLPTVDTLEPSATATPAMTATPEQVTMLSGEVNMADYSLRKGPGRLFDRVRLYGTGAVVSLIGRESSNNWVLVLGGDNSAGWMNVVGLTITGDLNSLPIFKVDNAQILHGHVYKSDGTPASGILVSLALHNNDLSNTADNVDTNSSGEWMLYLPIDTAGDYILGPNGYTCQTSNAVSVNTIGCSLLGSLPSAREITLPLGGDTALDFNILPLP